MLKRYSEHHAHGAEGGHGGRSLSDRTYASVDEAVSDGGRIGANDGAGDGKTDVGELARTVTVEIFGHDGRLTRKKTSSGNVGAMLGAHT